MKHQMYSDGFEMVRNADVTVSAVTSANETPVAVIDINGQFQHSFNPNSRVSKALHHNTVQDIASRFQGGNFFLHNGELVNFQYGDRKTFCHTDESIQALIDNIGYTDKNINRAASNRLQSNSIRLQSVRSAVDIQIPAYQDGGDLSSQLSFTWDPFQKTVNTAFELVRLICANGMTGMTNFLSNRIPLVNNWEEHLDIANKQIQNTVTSMISSRMIEMTSMRATVRDCQRVVDFCRSRLDGNPLNHSNPKALKILTDNVKIAEPMFHLTNHYTANVLQDRRIGDQYESHLNVFTLWNMLTEIATHTSPPEGNTGADVHKHANELVFDRGVVNNVASRGKVVLANAFSNPEAALVGDQL